LPSRSGGGLPCGAIGGTEEVMRLDRRRRIDQVGTFNGNPLTMAAMRATLTEILTPDVYTEFDRLAEILREGCDAVIERTGHRPATRRSCRPAARSPTAASACATTATTSRCPTSSAYINWLVQFNRGVFMAPWGKSENWTLSVQHSEDDVRRYVDNFEFLGKAISA
jgi:glutamate-1-semialdehyde 2,1-aminomutase